MKAMRRVLWAAWALGAALLPACGGGDDSDTDSADTDTGPDMTPAEVSGEATAARVGGTETFSFAGGVAFSDTRRDGALSVAISSWTDAPCEVDTWISTAPAVFAYAVFRVDQSEAEVEVEWQSESGEGGTALIASADVTASPGVAPLVGDPVTGTLDSNPTQGDSGTAQASFVVPYCGEQAAY